MATQKEISNLPALAFAGCLADGGIDAYIRSVSHFSILTKEEEYSLAKQLKENGDRSAAERLILSHLRYVVKVARGYLGYGLSFADLIQEGNIGLMKAVKRYDPEMGVRLVTFAMHWVKAEINEFVIKNWRMVKIATTKAQRKLFFKLRAAKQQFQQWLTPKQAEVIAADLGVKAAEVLSMEQRLAYGEASLEAMQDDDSASNLLDCLVHPGHTPHQMLELQQASSEEQLLYKLLNTLAERDRVILQQRWLLPEGERATLDQLALKFGISKQRVLQLEQRALSSLKQQLVVA
jgi:RNA polymerase sigma-32 factor